MSALAEGGSSRSLTAYRDLVPKAQLDAIDESSSALLGLRVVHLNTTWRGGGVAGLIDQLCPIASELGVLHERLVVELDAPSARFFAAMTNLLQGGGRGPLPEELKAAFLDHLARSADALALPSADLYIVHDPALAPLAAMIPALRPAIWFSHLDTADPNPAARDLVMSWLDDYSRIIFSTSDSVFPGLPPERVRLLRLGIDAFSPSNREMDSKAQRTVLSRHGIDPARPLISRISRFGTWKNPWQALEIYLLCKPEVPGLQLALVGALEASDDADAVRICDEIAASALDDPDIHVLSDPETVGSACVGAIQARSAVILQRSTREGFGFTVTEAMWKAKPVVGTSATGIKYQIRGGIDGIIADDTEAATNAVLDFLQDPIKAARIGAAARERVRQNHLLPALLTDYLDVVREFRR